MPTAASVGHANQRQRSGNPLAKRALDVCVAVLLLFMLALPLLLVLPQRPFRRISRLGRQEFMGRNGGSIALFPLDQETFGQRLAVRIQWLLAVLRGDLSMVGPRPLALTEAREPASGAAERGSVKPGLVCTWWLKLRSNIDYGTEHDADIDYVRNNSLRRDISILLRAAIVFGFGRQKGHWAADNAISGIRMVNLAMADLLNAIDAALAKRAATRIAFVNPDCVNVAARDSRYRQSLVSCDWVCADGIGMKLAGDLLGRPVRQNLNGTDLFPLLCASLAHSGHSLYLLGAQAGVAERAARWATDRFPALKIAGTRSGYFAPSEEQAVLAEIRAAKADVLLVAMGAARQEPWLEDNLAATGATIGIGVGGLFDFYSGRIPRAPLWLREIGGEWVYRLIQEPRRMWRRYLVGNAEFLLRIAAERLFHAGRRGGV